MPYKECAIKEQLSIIHLNSILVKPSLYPINNVTETRVYSS